MLTYTDVYFGVRTKSCLKSTLYFAPLLADTLASYKFIVCACASAHANTQPMETYKKHILFIIFSVAYVTVY